MGQIWQPEPLFMATFFFARNATMEAYATSGELTRGTLLVTPPDLTEPFVLHDPRGRTSEAEGTDSKESQSRRISELRAKIIARASLGASEKVSLTCTECASQVPHLSHLLGVYTRLPDLIKHDGRGVYR